MEKQVTARVEFSNGLTDTIGTDSETAALQYFVEKIKQSITYHKCYPTRLVVLEPRYKKLASYKLHLR